MSTSKKVLALAFGLTVLGGVSFAATQTNWLQGDFGDELGGGVSTGDDPLDNGMNIGTFEGSNGDGSSPIWGGNGTDNDIDDDDFGVGPVGPVGPGGGGGDLPEPEEEEPVYMYIAVETAGGDFIDGLSESQFTVETDVLDFREFSSNYRLEVEEEGEYEVRVIEDGYISNSDTFTAEEADDTVMVESLELAYSHVVTVVNESGSAVTGATVEAGANPFIMKECENYESNKYGCALPASATTRNLYEVSKSSYDDASGTFSTYYTSSSTSPVTATVTLTASETDEDSDGLTRTEELALGTDPEDDDSDDDGLKDGAEVDSFGTSPLDKDSDGDLLEDGDEINDYQSDARSIDGDSDGLGDYEEVMEYETNPRDSDSDNDGLTDWEEATNLYGYATDPNLADTDDGGVGDGTEVLTNGTDPLDGTDDVASETSTTEETTSFTCEDLDLSPDEYELDYDDDKANLTLTVTISFDSTIAYWQQPLFAQLASVELWEDELVVISSGDGEFEESDSGETGNPLPIAVSTETGTDIEIEYTLTDAEEGDVIRAFLDGDSDCKDSLTVTQEDAPASGDDDDDNDDDDDTTVNAGSGSSNSSYTTTVDTILTSESYNCSDTFTDTSSSWAEDIICRMTNADIVNGKVPPYIFEPNSDVTNAEAIKMIDGLLLGKDEGDSYGLSEGFSDVTSADWFEPWVKIAQDEDVIRTRDFGGYFFPNEACSRGQLAVYIVRALGLTSYGFNSDFSDVDEDDYFAYAVDLLSEKTVDVPYDSDDDEVAVIEGYENGTFRPYNDVSRAEALAMIYRAYLAYLN